MVAKKLIVSRFHKPVIGKYQGHGLKIAPAPRVSELDGRHVRGE